jgi:hypothetical protein
MAVEGKVGWKTGECNQLADKGRFSITGQRAANYFGHSFLCSALPILIFSAEMVKSISMG